MSETSEMTTLIEDTQLPLSWLKEALSQHFAIAEDVTIASCKTDIIGVGRGHLSKIMRLNLKWSSHGDGNLPDSVVLKLPSTNSVTDSGADIDAELGTRLQTGLSHWMMQIHKRECEYYKLCGEATAPVRIPRCYFSRNFSQTNPPVLIIEDMTPAGHGLDPAKTLSLTQLKSSVSMMAQFHAWSVLYSSWRNKEFQPLNQLVGDLVIDYAKGAGNQLKQTNSEYFGSILDDFLDYLKTPEALKLQTESQPLQRQFNMEPLLVHGDFWADNMLFNGENNDDAAVLLDFQHAHAGCAAEDFSRLMLVSVSPDLRRSKCTEVMDHYYHKLLELIPSNIQPPFTFHQLTAAYEEAALIELPLAVVLLSMRLAHITHSVEETSKLLHRIKCVLEDILPLTKK